MKKVPGLPIYIEDRPTGPCVYITRRWRWRLHHGPVYLIMLIVGGWGVLNDIKDFPWRVHS